MTNFFPEYHREFRRIKTKPEKEKIKKQILKNESIYSKYKDFTDAFGKKISFFKSSGDTARGALVASHLILGALS